MSAAITSRKTIALLVSVVAVFVAALAMRAFGEMPPYDDLYHLKRIEYSAAHFPAVLEFDSQRGEHGAFCPWPPLYDVSAGVIQRMFGSVLWLPPIFVSLFAAGLTAALWRFGPVAAITAGIAIAFSPHLTALSRVAHIDHHFLEPLLIAAVVLAVVRNSAAGIALSIAAALFVQPAMLVAAALAFIASFFFGDTRKAAIGFAVAALIVLAYRLTRSPGYPNSAWFLGYPQFAALGAAAIALALRPFGRVKAIAIASAAALAVPHAADAFAEGVRFFRSDPWLGSITEFKPVFWTASLVPYDIANVTGGCILTIFLWRRHRTLALFGIGYLALVLSSRRYLAEAIPLFVIGGAIFAAEARSRWTRIAAVISVALPPLLFTLVRSVPEISYTPLHSFGRELRAFAPGRVLAPWSVGHVIDVDGGHAVIADNFGWMPNETTFINANSVLLTTHAGALRAYCAARSVRYLVLSYPDRGLGGVAESIGIPPAYYDGTRLAQRTVWWRLYHGKGVEGFELIRDGALQVWRVNL